MDDIVKAASRADARYECTRNHPRACPSQPDPITLGRLLSALEAYKNSAFFRETWSRVKTFLRDRP